MPSWESIAIQHASTVAKYLIAHGESAEILATDPTKRDRMLKELSNSNAPWVRKVFKYDANEDVDALLRGWDEAISKTPVTFEDHFYRAHYATAAMSYSERDKVGPDVRKYGERFRDFLEDRVDAEYNVFLENLLGSAARVQCDSPPPPPPPSLNIPNITLDVAKVLLGTPAVLFATKFYHRGDDGSGYWAVSKINRSETAAGTSVQYTVAFDDDMAFDLDEGNVVHLMLASCVASAE